jgi:hypothetical protein
MRTSYKAPCFPIFFETRLAARASRSQRDGGASAEGVDWDHIPDVFGYDVGNQKIDVVGSVFPVGGVAGSNAVIMRPARVSGLDLHAPGTPAVIQDEIVAVAVALGLGNGKAEESCFVEKSGLASLTAPLDVKFGSMSLGGLAGRGFGWRRCSGRCGRS